ncbi:MAG: hypothetical protein H8E48_04385 [Chloroflexi bacterium]|nr:hypothetical protein [Chloroflexota bacterium]
MPFVMNGEIEEDRSTTGTQTNTLVGKDNGGDNLTVVSAGIYPGAGLALYVHPDAKKLL